MSGSLYKSGQGNLNSMAALVGIPLGVMAVEHGPLNGVHQTLRTCVINNADGGPVTFFSITHLPYWAMAAAIGGLLMEISVALFLMPCLYVSISRNSNA